MNKYENIKKWEAAEHKFIKQFGGKRATALETQYKDIDVEFPKTGKTFSIKDQAWSSGKYGGITIEHFTEAEDGSRMDGNFKYCEADTYGWLVTWNGVAQWLLIHCSVLKEYAAKNEERFKMKTTMASTTAQNASQGRKFTKAYITALPLKSLLEELTENVDYKLVKAQ